jgi:hypothetical protein
MTPFFLLVLLGPPDLIESCREAHDGTEATREEVLLVCRAALASERTADALCYTASTLSEDEPTKVELAEALMFAREASRLAPAALYVRELQCRIAAQAFSASDLDDCSRALIQLAPDNPEWQMYRVKAAILYGDDEAAHHALDRAATLGHPADQVAHARQVLGPRKRSGSVTPASGWLLKWWTLGLLALWIGGSILANIRPLRRSILWAAYCYQRLSIPALIVALGLFTVGTIQAARYLTLQRMGIVLVLGAVLVLLVFVLVRSLRASTTGDPGERITAVIAATEAPFVAHAMDRAWNPTWWIIRLFHWPLEILVRRCNLRP